MASVHENFGAKRFQKMSFEPASPSYFRQNYTIQDYRKER